MNDKFQPEPPQGVDGEWFDELVRQNHLPLYWHILKQVRNPADTEDVLQNVWERAWNHRDKLKEAEIPPAWLMKIDKNAIVDFIRKDSRQSERLAQSDPPEIENLPNPRDGRERRLELEFKEALDRLTDIQCEVVMLHFLDSLTAPEIALHLNIPLDTVYSRIRNARRRFRKYYKEE